MGKLFEGLDSRVLKDEARQARAQQAGVPCTTVLSGAILQRPGGRSSLAFQQARFLWPRNLMLIVPTRHLMASRLGCRVSRTALQEACSSCPQSLPLPSEACAAC